MGATREELLNLADFWESRGDMTEARRLRASAAEQEMTMQHTTDLERIIVDMSNQMSGKLFASGTDWYYPCPYDKLEEVLAAFATLGIPARVEWTIWQGEWDASEFPEDATVARHPSEAGNLLVTLSNGVK